MLDRRSLPSVDRALRELNPTDLPRPAAIAVIRRELQLLREGGESLDPPAITQRLRAALNALRMARIRPVINATGILIHTNLGRSPLGPAAVEAMVAAASNYTNLELDLTGGARGGRAAYLEHGLAVLCESESATVVNNCAAALVLILRHFTAAAPRNRVIISRGELVQIGGGFRIPDILAASGAVLQEIGTTNKTTLDDYAAAIGTQTAMILKVHRANFYMDGFVETPATDALARLAREAKIPFVEDLGSGATWDTATLGGNEHEPTPAETIGAGVDLITFSGDKLLGGPQAGIIAGRADYVGALKKEPFFRALRCDKLVLSALQATIDAHLSRSAGSTWGAAELPLTAMIETSLDSLRARAALILAQLKDAAMTGTLGSAQSQIGGGSLPRTRLESVSIDLQCPHYPAEDLATRLRTGLIPVIATVADNRVRLDLRTVFPEQDEALLHAIREAIKRT